MHPITRTNCAPPRPSHPARQPPRPSPLCCSSPRLPPPLSLVPRRISQQSAPRPAPTSSLTSGNTLYPLPLAAPHPPRAIHATTLPPHTLPSLRATAARARPGPAPGGRARRAASAPTSPARTARTASRRPTPLRPRGPPTCTSTRPITAHGPPWMPLKRLPCHPCREIVDLAMGASSGCTETHKPTSTSTALSALSENGKRPPQRIRGGHGGVASARRTDLKRDGGGGGEGGTVIRPSP